MINAVALAAGAWLLLVRSVLGPAEDWERHRAVKVQEQFDMHVFQLPWNRQMAGAPIAEENIAKAAAKHKGTAPDDWYADTKDIARPLDIILCQRSSAVWGRGTHLTYAIVLAAGSVLILLVGVAVALRSEATLSNYLLRIFLPTLPALLETIDMARLNWATSRLKGEIESAADALWQAGVEDLTSVTDMDARTLQDQTYRLRLQAPRIAKWLYLMRRASDERAMRAAVEQRIAEYRASITS